MPKAAPRSNPPVPPLQAPAAPQRPTPRILITAGPTHEPIDAVRFIGNRSSGRMGVALAHECVKQGFQTTLALGPAPVQPSDPRVRLLRFRTCEDLQKLLAAETPQADILIMAAAVADYRPKVDPAFFGGKFRRKNENLTLELEPTPDLLAEVGKTRRDDQLFVGFALEPRAEMLDAAQAKMQRKRIDMVVANPLETMDSDEIEATILFAPSVGKPPVSFEKRPKSEAAGWIVQNLMEAYRERAH
jgi:phosphopantothenoylcysteine decarboxylase/phosphopantothenate--cysteine ligase